MPDKEPYRVWITTGWEDDNTLATFNRAYLSDLLNPLGREAFTFETEDAVHVIHKNFIHMEQ